MFQFNTVEEALEDLKKGKLILVTDDEDRENEGDLICAAEFATTENVNFMATHAKGLICMPMGEEIIKKLQIPQMVSNNTDNHETAFTVSIDHVDTTTGISAAERSITAMKCVDEDAKPEDFRRPGHMFPLLAKANGVLERNGHTEATVDLMKLAGLKECGLCCEIMRDDGTMMRTPELKEMAQKYNFSIEQNKQLAELLDKQYASLWSSVIYGSSVGNTDIVEVAKKQIGNIGGQPFWSWYGYNSRVEWCACFVSWCANECGYIEAGIIPKFASCESEGVAWFKTCGLWQEKGYTPKSGDIIFFDWADSNDGLADHVGIVSRVENGIIYTVEGNTRGDVCKENKYSIDSSVIRGFGTPAYK